MSSTGI
ncbi:unnamed protein product [Staurois parvus]|nr:unnamed protein product [Staurois parvus]